LIGSEIWLARRRKGADDELVHLARARLLLEANLTEQALTPRSLEWRDSLFALGNVLSMEAKVQETSSRRLGVDDRIDAETTKAGLKELENSYATNLQAIVRLDV
jgi:hypothetical protein